MARPKRVPTWATDATFTSGPEFGLSTRLEPLTGEKAQGYYAQNRPPARKINWTLGSFGDALDFLIDVGLLNFRPIVYDLNNVILNLSSQRGDTTGHAHKSFWGACWLVCGSATAGSVYVIVGNGIAVPLNGIGASPPHWHHGASVTNTSIREVVFNADTMSASNPCVYAYSGVQTIESGTWTKANLPGTYGAGSAHCADSCTTNSGKIVAVGGGGTSALSGTGDLNAWVSSDGVTFTAVSVAQRITFGIDLTRVIVGKNGRLVAWSNASVVNGGGHIYYSDDEGSTWTRRLNVFASGSVNDGCYSAVDDCYYFVHGQTIGTFSDLTSGSELIVQSLASTTLWSIKDLGGVLVFTGVNSGFWYVWLSRDSGVTARIIDRTFDGSRYIAADPALEQLCLVSNSGALGDLHDLPAVSLSLRLSGTY